MATQQILFAETIAGMKKAFKRKSYESDSDSEIDHYTNRGHKLKKRARFAHKGQLIPATGPGTYKEGVDYAGVQRSIIYRNPPLLDDEGYPVDSEDDEVRVEDALIAAAELNPYANIRLEHILAPLTASTDLPTHLTLSKPFTSRTLTELVDHSSRIVRKENQSLWEVRHLLTALCGDCTWLPTELMIGSNDVDLFSEDHLARHLQGFAQAEIDLASALPHLNGGASNQDQMDEQSETDVGSAGSVKDKGTDDVKSRNKSADNESRSDKAKDKATAMEIVDKSESGETRPNGDAHDSQKLSREPVRSHQHNEGKSTDTADEARSSKGDAQITERDIHGQNAKDDDQAQSATVSEESTFIHPMFLPPAGVKPDRDLGLPETEAEDIRRLLALYVQKQEEVCRGAFKLQQGLLRAERLRHEVLNWSKAEAHSGTNRDMSDGEDWYDKEEWGLDEDLKKGQDEEEEEIVTQGKKTRNRRQ